MAKEYLGSSPSLDTDIITKSYVDTQISNISLSLNDLSNVNTSPADGEGLIWNESAGEWQSGLVGGTVNSLNDVGDVNVPTPTNGHVLSWNSVAGEWQDVEIGPYVSKTGDVMTGALTAPDYYINNINTRITEGLGDTIRLQTSSGYVDIGPQNTSYAHFQTDRNAFYFNKPLDVANQITVYGTYTFLSVAEGKIDGNIIWHAGNDGSGSGLDADLLDGLDSTAFSLTTHNHDSTYLKLSGGTLTGNLSINKTLAVIDAGSSSSNVLSLQSMGSVEVVIDSNNNDTDKLFSIKSNSQTNDPITKVDETGNFTTSGYVAVSNGSARMEYNTSTESVDFVFV